MPAFAIKNSCSHAITVGICCQYCLSLYFAGDGNSLPKGLGVFRVGRLNGRKIGVRLGLFINGSNLYFEVDLGNVSSFADAEFYFKILDLNTEIQPVSFGINNTNTNDPRLVLVESRDGGDLNDDELLSVFDALELAVDRAEELLTAKMKD